MHHNVLRPVQPSPHHDHSLPSVQVRALDHVLLRVCPVEPVVQPVHGHTHRSADTNTVYHHTLVLTLEGRRGRGEGEGRGERGRGGGEGEREREGEVGEREIVIFQALSVVDLLHVPCLALYSHTLIL